MSCANWTCMLRWDGDHAVKRCLQSARVSITRLQLHGRTRIPMCESRILYDTDECFLRGTHGAPSRAKARFHWMLWFECPSCSKKYSLRCERLSCSVA